MNMVRQYKYTIDGRKFVVTSDINEHACMCREILVDSYGNEYESKEETIEKKIGLYDDFVIRWSDKRIKESDDEYARHKKELDEKLTKHKNEVDEEMKSLDIELKTLHDKRRFACDLIKYYESLIKTDNTDALEKLSHMLDLMLRDEPAYYIDKHYNISCLDNDIRINHKHDIYGCPKLRLLTFYGNTNGNIYCELNDYGDGSGDCIDFDDIFDSEKDAIDALKKRIIEMGVIDRDIFDTALRYGFIDELNQETVEKYKRDCISENERFIKMYEKEIDAKKKDIEYLKNVKSTRDNKK